MQRGLEVQPDNRAVRMLHATKMATMTDIAVREICVDVFDMVKQKSNSVIKNVTILLRSVERSCKYEAKLTSRRWAMIYGHMRSAHGRLKMIAIGSRPKSTTTIPLSKHMCLMSLIFTHRTRGISLGFQVGDVATNREHANHNTSNTGLY